MQKTYIGEYYDYSYDTLSRVGIIEKGGQKVLELTGLVARRINALLNIQQKIDTKKEEITQIYFDECYGREHKPYPKILFNRSSSDCHSTANFLIYGTHPKQSPYNGLSLNQGGEQLCKLGINEALLSYDFPFLIRAGGEFHHSVTILGELVDTNDLILFEQDGEGEPWRLISLSDLRKYRRNSKFITGKVLAYGHKKLI